MDLDRRGLLTGAAACAAMAALPASGQIIAPWRAPGVKPGIKFGFKPAPVGSTVFISDTFTEATSKAIEAHLPEIGGSYTKIGNGGTVNGTFTSGTGTESGGLNSAVPPSADYTTEATFISGEQLQMYLRATISGIYIRNGYFFFCGGTSISMAKKVNDAYTNFGSVNKTLVAGDVVGFRCLGSAITVLVNGIEIRTVVDTSLTAPNFCGIACSSNSRGSGTWDNFRAYT